jgi:hypothetical protein
LLNTNRHHLPDKDLVLIRCILNGTIQWEQMWYNLLQQAHLPSNINLSILHLYTEWLT